MCLNTPIHDSYLTLHKDCMVSLLDYLDPSTLHAVRISGLHGVRKFNGLPFPYWYSIIIHFESKSSRLEV